MVVGIGFKANLFKLMVLHNDTSFFFFLRFIYKKKVQKQHLFEIEIFCNTISVFTVIFDQFKVALMNKNIN